MVIKLKMVLLKDLLSKRNKAFTLAETVVVTFIVAFLALIPPLYLKGYQESVDLLNAKRIFRTAINSTARQAAISHSIRTINYSPSTHQIYVSSGNEKSKRYNLSESINISGFPIHVSQDGNISPKTITVSNGRDKTNIRIQMMWGKMIDD